MKGDSELNEAYSLLGEAASSLYFAGHGRLAEKIRNLQSDIGELL